MAARSLGPGRGTAWRGGAVTDEQWKTLAASAGARAESVTAGLYGPRSATWRLLREQIVLLTVGRALLLQVAHPAVAAGVAQHSDYERDAFGRALRTLDALHRIAFGDLATALRAGYGVWSVHGRVHGLVPDETSSPFAGRPYDARDPALGLWVHATTLESWVRGYEALVGPLDADDRERFWGEARATAGLFGLPPEVLPATWTDLVRYVDDMVAGPVLQVGPTAARIRASLFSNRSSTVLGGVFGLHVGPLLRLLDAPPARASLRDLAELLTAGFLPPRLRDAFDLPWSARRSKLFGLACAGLRRVVPLLPGSVRWSPSYRAAVARLTD